MNETALTPKPEIFGVLRPDCGYDGSPLLNLERRHEFLYTTSTGPMEEIASTQKVSLVQWGQRHQFRAVDAFVEKGFHVTAHVAHSRPNTERFHFVPTAEVINYRTEHFVTKLLDATWINPEVDLKWFGFMDRFHTRVSKKIYGKHVLSIGNSYELGRRLPDAFLVHEQVSCAYDLARLRNTIGGLNYDLEKVYRRELETFERADIVVCPSKTVLNYVKKVLPTAKCEFVPYPVPEGHDQDRPRFNRNVLFVGRIEPVKGDAFIVIAAKSLPGLTFHLIGENRSTIDFPSNVIIHGRLPHNEVQKHFRSADIFLFPSLSEGSATVAHEAMALDLPAVISSKSGSHYEHEITGLLFDPDEHNAADNMVEQLRVLSTNRCKYTRMVKNIRHRKTDFTYNAYRDRLAELFK